MKETLQNIKEQTLQKIAESDNLDILNEIRISVLGKKGELTSILKGMKDVAPEDRPMVGQLVNDTRVAIEKELQNKKEAFEKAIRDQKLKQEVIDVTLPPKKIRVGHSHPNTVALEEVERIFVGMGYEVVEGPEVEFDHYNFELLNIPKNHPARDAQDTFYIDENIVLRTHTSPVQARIMTTRKPPIRIICPGRVYRADEADATHSPVFHQMEGLVIDEKITMGDLKGTLDEFARQMFDEGVSTRFRPSFFPFTEPSAEVDLTCANCHGEGCRMCKGTGWIEVLGAGMVNPRVLEMCGIDSGKYSGFAFGMGVERMALLKYNIPNLRYLYENDLRFLTQYR